MTRRSNRVVYRGREISDQSSNPSATTPMARPNRSKTRADRAEVAVAADGTGGAGLTASCASARGFGASTPFG